MRRSLGSFTESSSSPPAASIHRMPPPHSREATEAAAPFLSASVCRSGVTRTKQGANMIGHASMSVPELGYDRFLYASICEQNNGTQVTVLSALVRADIDPWEEATRLATMPRAKAEATLSSLLRQISDQRWTDAEVEAVSERLVQLLPTKEGGESATVIFSSIGEVDRSIFWLIWLGLALAVSFNSPRNQPSISEPGSAVTSPAVLSAAASNASDRD
jgi:hypothetical protein